MNETGGYYKGYIITYVERRKGYIVHYGINHRYDYVFTSMNEAKQWIDGRI